MGHNGQEQLKAPSGSARFVSADFRPKLAPDQALKQESPEAFRISAASTSSGLPDFRQHKIEAGSYPNVKEEYSEASTSLKSEATASLNSEAAADPREAVRQNSKETPPPCACFPPNSCE
jgi:hypothetical protein